MLTCHKGSSYYTICHACEQTRCSLFYGEGTILTIKFWVCGAITVLNLNKILENILHYKKIRDSHHIV